MLRISQVIVGSMVRLRLEGKLVKAWVAEFREHCEQLRNQGHSVVLDLSKLTYVDAAGAVVLNAFRDLGMEITDCSDFVAELLGWEKQHDRNDDQCQQ